MKHDHPVDVPPHLQMMEAAEIKPASPPPRPSKRKGRRFFRILQWLFAMGILATFAALVAIALVFKHYSADLPSTEQLTNYDPAVVTRLYAADGKLMAEYAKEKRFFLPLSAIPMMVQHAFVSAEDQNFYTHKGVDFWAIVRAMRNNLLNAGGRHNLAGGSTITQQVVKNFLLTNEKSLERKFKEAILAYRISNTYSKEKILELYLNQIYLGQGTYGVAAAANNYFNKSLDELKTEEAAMLAAMPKEPANLDPTRNYKRALERRNYVITRMQSDGYIDAKEAARAIAAPIITRTRADEEVHRADFFAEEVRRGLASMYGSNVLYQSGLFVKTTLNTSYQTYADRALRFALMQYDQRHGYRGPIAKFENDGKSIQAGLTKIQLDKNIPIFDTQALAVVQNVNAAQAQIVAMNGDRGVITLDQLSWARRQFPTGGLGPAVTAANQVLNVGDVILVEPMDAGKSAYRLLQIPEVNGAMVVMDPHTGKVLALSGGYSYSGSEFNRATQAKRQPGSAFKPFVYMTALENGFSPNSIVVDGPVELPQGPGLPMWKPKNYESDFLGPTTFRIGLEKSRNLMTVRIAQLVGIKRIKRVAKRLGIYTDDDNVAENYSMVLGSYETTLLKLVNAYSMVANGGRRVSPWLIERIDDRNGTTIFRRDTRVCETCQVLVEGSPVAPTITDERERVIDPRVAYQMTSLLQGVVQRGTATAATVLKRPIAGKTGTTNDSRDTWFIGFTPDIVVGTYIGFDVPRSMGEKETGGRVAIQGFIKFMQQAGDSMPIKSFKPPPGIREIAINRLSGQPLYAAGGSSAANGAAAGVKQSVIQEAFLTGGPIFKPMNELQEELKNKEIEALPEQSPAPAAHDPSIPDKNFTPPDAGALAPYQRPIDPQGFNPNGRDAAVGTGGLY